MSADYSKQVEQLVAEFITKLGFQATVVVDVEEFPATDDGVEKHDAGKALNIKLQIAEGAEMLIGRYGSILDAISTVVRMIVPADAEGNTYNVILDVNGYRDERTKYLQDLARRTADDVNATRQPIALSPMKPWERRVIHTELTNRTDVMTTSAGEEPNRRVIISVMS